MIYLLHRLAHLRNRFNPLYKIHIHHHKVNYLSDSNRKFKWYYLLFYFGGVYETIDVLILLTLPAVSIYLVYPGVGIYLLFLHYIYEVFFSEGLLDHNPAIKGRVTNVFAWGEYHLAHHKTWKYNYSLIITLWDYVFGTKKRAIRTA